MRDLLLSTSLTTQSGLPLSTRQNPIRQYLPILNGARSPYFGTPGKKLSSIFTIFPKPPSCGVSIHPLFINFSTFSVPFDNSHFGRLSNPMYCLHCSSVKQRTKCHKNQQAFSTDKCVLSKIVPLVRLNFRCAYPIPAVPILYHSHETSAKLALLI